MHLPFLKSVRLIVYGAEGTTYGVPAATYVWYDISKFMEATTELMHLPSFKLYKGFWWIIRL